MLASDPVMQQALFWNQSKFKPAAHLAMLQVARMSDEEWQILEDKFRVV